VRVADGGRPVPGAGLGEDPVDVGLDGVVAQEQLRRDLRVGQAAGDKAEDLGLTLGGLAALALMGVYRSPDTGKPVSRAGAPYAVLWIVVIGARAAFSYGAAHWCTAPLVSWAITNQVSVAAITDGLIFMAIAMVLVRTLGLGLRASRLPTPALAPQSA